MSRAIGVRIDDTVEWHAPPVGSSDYNTMCGIDADDPTIGHYGFVEPSRGQKITCITCLTIWRDTLALRLRKTDFHISAKETT